MGGRQARDLRVSIACTDGRLVALVSNDSAFGDDPGLASALADEVAALSGEVELVRDLGAWLLARLPWSAAAAHEAVAQSQDEEFTRWFLESDFQIDLHPPVSTLGLRQPLDLQVEGVEWDGLLTRVGQHRVAPGVEIVESDVGQLVECSATFDDRDLTDDESGLAPGRSSGTSRRQLDIEMVVRVEVLYGTEDLHVEAVTWRRADREPPVPAPALRDQDPLF